MKIITGVLGLVMALGAVGVKGRAANPSAKTFRLDSLSGLEIVNINGAGANWTLRFVPARPESSIGHPEGMVSLPVSGQAE